jgi:hypothetical protein
MSRDSIGVVTTGRRKLQEWKTTQKQNLSRKSRGTLTVKWAGSRDKIFSPSGRGRTFFLTSLFIELIERFDGNRRFSTKMSRVWSVVEKAVSQAPVELRKRVGKHDRHDEDARPQGERVFGLAQIKAAYTTDKQVADGKVEEAP